jgi:hypothetical protein
MSAPSLTDYFGIGAQVVTDPLDITATLSATNPALVIPMSALADVGLSVALSMSLPDPVFFAIFKKVYRFSRADIDEKTFVEVSEPSLNLATRDGKFMETLDYRISAYRLRSQNIDFDPDQLTATYVP